jgi:hypothetical protein
VNLSSILKVVVMVVAVGKGRCEATSRAAGSGAKTIDEEDRPHEKVRALRLRVDAKGRRKASRWFGRQLAPVGARRLTSGVQSEAIAATC